MPSGEAAQTLASAISKLASGDWTGRWGLNREALTPLLRVRTGPECPKGNLRELT